MPGAKWSGEHSPEVPMSRYDIVCVHTIVGRAPAHAAHFSTAADGTIYQSRDTHYRSAANLAGNHRVISIENEDMGGPFPKWGGSDVPTLTDAQLVSIAKILKWAHETHGVPLQLCPDSRPTSRGLAYHRQGIDGNFGTKANPFPGRVSGGEVWTEHRGKVCPGDRRIAQLPEILALAKGTDPKEPQMNHVEKAHEHLKNSARELQRALTELDQVKPDRLVVKTEQSNLREAREIIADSRNRLPEK
jgi:hypothetical protein